MTWSRAWRRASSSNRSRCWRRPAGASGSGAVGTDPFASLLDGHGRALGAAGLKRLNVSLDSLARDRFFELTRRDALDEVLAGLEAAEAYPELRPIKVNAVALRNFTEDEALRFAELARRKPYEVRFIEF